MATSVQPEGSGPKPQSEGLIARSWRWFRGEIVPKYIAGLLVAVTTGVIAQRMGILGDLAASLLVAVQSVWAFLVQPVAPPLVTFLGLGVSVAVLGFLQWTIHRRNAPKGAREDTPTKAKREILSWPDFGDVFYKVKGGVFSFGRFGFQTDGPFCSKCCGPVTRYDGSPCRDDTVRCRCSNERCLVLITLPMNNVTFKKRAEATIEAEWNNAIAEEAEPVLKSGLTSVKRVPPV